MRAGYALASGEEHGAPTAYRLQGPGVSWATGLSPPPPDSPVWHLSRRIGQRLAARCQEIADGVGGPELFGMFRYVSERGEAHEQQLCPPDAPGAGADTSHCDEAGRYSAVRGFAHAVCKSELEDCTDDDRPDPAVAEAGTRSVNAEL